MNRSAGILLTVLLLAALAAAAWWFFLRSTEPVAPDEPAVESTEREPDYETEVGDDIAVEEDEPGSTGEHAPSEDDGEEGEEESRVVEPDPLPTLDTSDGFMRSLLGRILSSEVLDKWLKDERIVERLVVIINSLDDESISLRFWPVHHIEGLPDVEQDDDRMYWSETNTQRYQAPVEILRSTEPAEVARIYFHSYPLFQQAYESLGLEEAEFNDRLIEIIDHLLEAPALEPGFEVKQPKVLYEFADPKLEAESWGRKLLMRMGPDHSTVVKAWLRELRSELVSGKPASGETVESE